MDPDRRARVSALLARLGAEVTSPDTGPELLTHVRAHQPLLALVDHDFAAVAGDGTWREVSASLPTMPIVVVSTDWPGTNSDPAVPGDDVALTPSLLKILGTLIEHDAPASASDGSCTDSPAALEPFVGNSPAIRHLAEEAHTALASESPILIEGETGAGKGVLAAWLHRHSSRACRAFVEFSCAGNSPELLESELLGDEGGEFEGPLSSGTGLLEVAEGGTLLLDEIGDLDPATQARLLRVLGKKRFRRRGETSEHHANIRIFVTTQRHLLDWVQQGRFREDLYYRISILSLHVPPLRDRASDIPVIARQMLKSLACALGRPEPALSPSAERILLGHSWPGNLRELRNVLERALLASGTGPIEPGDLVIDAHVTPFPPAGSEASTLEEMKRAYIERVLEEEHHHVERAARRLGIPRSTFYQQLRALGIPARRESAASLHRPGSR